MALDRLNHALWIPLLAVRVAIGLLFFENGLEKIEHLGALTERLSAWRIPWPATSAAVGAFTELVGGALVTVGLATRPAAIALALIVSAAIVVGDTVALQRPLYGIVFIWLVYAGAGRYSLDRLIRARLDSRQRLP